MSNGAKKRLNMVMNGCPAIRDSAEQRMPVEEI